MPMSHQFIFKKGSKSDAGNYRPVSLTSVACKILESFRDSVVKYRPVDDNEFRPISTSQHDNLAITLNL